MNQKKTLLEKRTNENVFQYISQGRFKTWRADFEPNARNFSRSVLYVAGCSSCDGQGHIAWDYRKATKTPSCCTSKAEIFPRKKENSEPSKVVSGRYVCRIRKFWVVWNNAKQNKVTHPNILDSNHLHVWCMASVTRTNLSWLMIPVVSVPTQFVLPLSPSSAFDFAPFLILLRKLVWNQNTKRVQAYTWIKKKGCHFLDYFRTKCYSWSYHFMAYLTPGTT